MYTPLAYKIGYEYEMQTTAGKPTSSVTKCAKISHSGTLSGYRFCNALGNDRTNTTVKNPNPHRLLKTGLLLACQGKYLIVDIQKINFIHKNTTILESGDFLLL